MMAKKTRAKAKAKPAQEKVKAADVMKMPPESIVKSVASDMASTRKEVGGLNKELRDVVADAKKEKGLHPAALRLVEGLVHKAKKTDRGLTAVATFLAHVDYYRDVLGLDEMLKKQGQMFARKEAGEKEPDEPELPTTPARETEETAGGPAVH